MNTKPFRECAPYADTGRCEDAFLTAVLVCPASLPYGSRPLV